MSEQLISELATARAEGCLGSDILALRKFQGAWNIVNTEPVGSIASDLAFKTIRENVGVAARFEIAKAEIEESLQSQI